VRIRISWFSKTQNKRVTIFYTNEDNAHDKRRELEGKMRDFTWQVVK
jgi:hypothetical protein